jgi:hypothetical protein
MLNKKKCSDISIGNVLNGVVVPSTKKPVEVLFRDNGDFLLFGLKDRKLKK